MMRRQRRQSLLYETAFDSRVRPAGDEVDHPLDSLVTVRGGERAASRSSFGSTSGSSASSTPTHRPLPPHADIRHHSPPTGVTANHERRRVTLVRDHHRVAQPRSASPQARPPRRVNVINQNFERKITFGSSSSTHHLHHPPWDGVSRCSGSDRSSSQESMSVEQPCPRNVAGRSASRDGLDVLLSERRNVAAATSHSDRKGAADPSRDSVPKSHHHTTDENKVDDGPRSARTQSGLPTACRPPADPELKENDNSADPPRRQQTSPRPGAGMPLSEVRPPDQSPENDDRTSRDYDPPWDLKLPPANVLRPSVNGSVSVPERLSSGTGGGPSMPTSVTHDKLDGEGGPVHKPNRPNGVPVSSRPNLNLNLGSVDSPARKGGRQNLTLNFGCTALGAVGEKVDPQLTLEKQGWYHGSISRVDAEGKLRVLKEGSYLVRNSESSKQDYSLSLRSARGFMHMKIVPTSEGRFILGQFSNPFSSIPEMIQHYSVNKLPIKGAEHMSLLYPVIEQLL